MEVYLWHQVNMVKVSPIAFAGRCWFGT